MCASADSARLISAGVSVQRVLYERARAWVQQRAGAPFSYPTNMIVVPCCALLLTEESGVVGT
jgi:hypothetical protein